MPDNTDVADNERNPADSGPIFPDVPISVSGLMAAVSPAAVSADAVNGDPAAAVPAADVATEQTTEAAAGVERDAPDKSAQFRNYAEFLMSFAAPNVLSEKWAFLGERDAKLRIDISPIEFVESLEQEYTVEALSELGLYERVDDELRLPSWLDGNAPLYFALDEVNFTVTFSRGGEFLFPMAHTALDYALERNLPESTQTPVTLFVVASQDDVEIMQRLGLRAVAGEGLQALGRDDVQRLFSGDHRSDLGWRYYLVLLDLDVALLENRRMTAIGEVIKRLADAEEVYGVDPARRFGVCRPIAREFHGLERAINFKDSAQICELFENWSAAAKSARVSSWRTHFDTEVLSFSASRAELTRALQQTNELARRADVLVALPAYRLAGRGVVIQRFYEAIDRASDPFDQVDLIAAAGYADTFLDSDPLVRAGEAVLAGKTPPSARELDEELFAQRQRCMVELRRIRRDRKAKR